ncbi:hypothetical protein CDAR_506161 [Caerostris darwini]|uniref:Uncharacterized protein n=1 Tax=Caerostris darwini TaxID=1538125 RepID=A0AAV4TPJ4_9ARAC|nr:hypothetical protein CDAR_506161 [Caerostris darwini]
MCEPRSSVGLRSLCFGCLLVLQFIWKLTGSWTMELGVFKQGVACRSVIGFRALCRSPGITPILFRREVNNSTLGRRVASKIDGLPFDSPLFLNPYQEVTGGTLGKVKISRVKYLFTLNPRRVYMWCPAEKDWEILVGSGNYVAKWALLYIKCCKNYVAS